MKRFIIAFTIAHDKENKFPIWKMGLNVPLVLNQNGNMISCLFIVLPFYLIGQCNTG